MQATNLWVTPEYEWPAAALYSALFLLATSVQSYNQSSAVPYQSALTVIACHTWYICSLKLLQTTSYKQQCSAALERSATGSQFKTYQHQNILVAHQFLQNLLLAFNVYRKLESI